jgi:hypothetical protein
MKAAPLTWEPPVFVSKFPGYRDTGGSERGDSKLNKQTLGCIYA